MRKLFVKFMDWRRDKALAAYQAKPNLRTLANYMAAANGAYGARYGWLTGRN